MSKYYLEYTPDGIKVRDKTVADGRDDHVASIAPEDLFKDIMNRAFERMLKDRKANLEAMPRPDDMSDDQWVVAQEINERLQGQEPTLEASRASVANIIRDLHATRDEATDLRQQLAEARRELEQRPVVRWVPTRQQAIEFLQRSTAWEITDDETLYPDLMLKWVADCQSPLPAPAQPAEPDASKVTRLWIALDDDDYRELQAEADKRLAEGRELPEGHSCEIGGIIGEIVRDLNEYRDLYEAGMSKATENLPYKPADQPATAEAGTGEEVPLPEGHTEVEGYPLLCEDGGGYVLSRESHNDQRLIAYSFLTSQHLERMRSGKYKPATVRQVAEFMIRNLAAAANLAVTFTPTP